MGGFNKLIGRYTPYGEYPYLIQQNAKIRQMNSLVQRDSGNLYKQISDPYGQNPFGEFGTDLQATELQAQGEGGTSIERITATETPGTIPSTTEPPIDAGTGQVTQQPMDGGAGQFTEPLPAEIAKETQQPGVKQPTFKYNTVDIPFCKEYINTPWYNWNFNSSQQSALNFLQARGDELLINYYSAENKYPPLASLFFLPNTNPKFTKYNYSDRQMGYLYYKRNPSKFRFICPRYDMYVTNWCNYFYRFEETCKNHGVGFTETEIYQLLRDDVMSKASYEIYGSSPLAEPQFGRGGGMQEINMGGYLNWRLVEEFKKNKSAAIAKVNAVSSQNVYIPGTEDTFMVSTNPRPPTAEMYQTKSGEFIARPDY